MSTLIYLYPGLKQNLYRFHVALSILAGRVSIRQEQDYFISLEGEIPELEGLSAQEIYFEVGSTLQASHTRLLETMEDSECLNAVTYHY